MSQVNPIGNSPITPVNAPAASRPAAPVKLTHLTDKLELSGVSHLLASLKTNDVRTDKVASIRAQLEAGTYENDQKLDIAIDRLLEELAR